MSLISKTQACLSPQLITYTKANEFLKLLDEERPAHELSLILSPATYTIGQGSASLHWDGQVATHTPPNGEVEIYDYLIHTPNRKNQKELKFGDPTRRGGAPSTSMASELAQIQNGSSRGLQSALQRGGGDGFGEVSSPWARGWAEAERQEQRRR